MMSWHILGYYEGKGKISEKATNTRAKIGQNIGRTRPKVRNVFTLFERGTFMRATTV